MSIPSPLSRLSSQSSSPISFPVTTASTKYQARTRKPKMPLRSTRPPKLDSLLPPILSLLTLTPPNPYSAHQKALTTTARLAQSGHTPLAIEILFSTSRELLKLGEAGSGVELGVRMVQVMGDAEVTVDDKSRGSRSSFLRCFVRG